MIYYTHSYHRHRTGIELINSGLVENKIYVNKMHTIGKNVNSTLSNYDCPIIFESPLYVSNFVDRKNSFVIREMNKRGLLSELTDSSKAFYYLNDTNEYLKDVKECWESYLKNIPEGNIEKVISLPAYNKNIEKIWDEIYKIVPSSNYKWISLAISYSDISLIDTNLLVKRVIELKSKLNTEGILFTVLSPEPNINYQLDILSLVNEIIENLSLTGEVLIHHANTLAIQSTKVKNLAFGIHNQTKSMAMNQQPFIEMNGILRSKSTSFLSSSYISDIHKKRFEAAVSRLKDLGYSNFSNFKELKILEEKMNDNFSGKGEQDGSTFMAAREFSKILKMSKKERESAGEKFIDVVSDMPITRKELVYKIDGSKMKIL